VTGAKDTGPFSGIAAAEESTDGIGIDVGLEQAVAHLYTIWQKDPDAEQPKRAQVGIVNAINAHNRARKFTREWTPPTCPPGG